MTAVRIRPTPCGYESTGCPPDLFSPLKTVSRSSRIAGDGCPGNTFSRAYFNYTLRPDNRQGRPPGRKTAFLRVPDPEALAHADIADVEPIIHSLGFYHAKARHIIAAAKTLITDFGGEVPDTMEGLLSIPGVGRKTANIVLYHGYGKNHGIAVDTHVRRLAQRIGFSDTDDVKVIENDLMALFPSKEWGDLTDVFIAHGRACCTAKKPQCLVCVIKTLCRYYRTTQKDK